MIRVILRRSEWYCDDHSQTCWGSDDFSLLTDKTNRHFIIIYLSSSPLSHCSEAQVDTLQYNLSIGRLDLPSTTLAPCNQWRRGGFSFMRLGLRRKMKALQIDIKVFPPNSRLVWGWVSWKYESFSCYDSITVPFAHYCRIKLSNL